MPVILELEKSGYEVVFEPVESNVTVILSGTYTNPFCVGGKRILVVHGDEWGIPWSLVYKPIVKEYYDKVIDIKPIPIDKIMDVIRGEIETTESRSKD